MKYIKEEEQKKPAKKIARLVRIGVVFFLAVFFLEVWAMNRLATYGDKIQAMKMTEESLELENRVLESGIASSSALAPIENKAVQLGFDSVKNFSYPVPPSLASLP